MKLTDTQADVLRHLSKTWALEAYGLQIGSCRALTKRGLAYMHHCGTKWSITDEGRKWLEHQEKTEKGETT